MADPQKARDPEPSELHEYTPAELRDNLSAFDPQALAADASPAAVSIDQAHAKGGAPPDDTAEQTRRDQKASEFNNNPERSRDEHLINMGRGHHTHG